MVANTFNPSTQEAEAGGSLSLRPAWSTEQVPGQPGLFQKKTKRGKSAKYMYFKTKKLRLQRQFYLTMCFSRILGMTGIVNVKK